MSNDSQYWNRFWRRQTNRRRLLQGSALGAAGLAAAALVGCGGDDEPGPGPTGGATTAPTGGATTAPTGAVSWPNPPEYSKLPKQKLVGDYHWSKVGPKAQVLGTPRMGGVAAFAGLVTNPTLHPNEPALPAGQWSYVYSHSNLVGMDWSHTKNPDLVPATNKYAVSESWETPDAQTFVYKLRPQVTWHNTPPANGEKLSIADIQETFKLYTSNRFFTQYFNALDSITEPTAGTVRFKFKEPAAQMFRTLMNPSFSLLNAKHIAEGDEALKNKDIGTGAFMVTKYEVNKVRILKRNPTWWWPKDQFGNQLPYLDGIVHQGYRDAAAIVAGVRANQIDYLRPSNVEEFERLVAELDMWGQASVGTCACVSPIVAVSHRTPEFKDVRVRRALSLAVDRQKLLDNVFAGAGTAHTFLPFYFLGYQWPQTWAERGEWYKYDPQAAKTLLQQAGIPAGFKVELHYAGQISPGGGVEANAPVESVRQDLKAIGIELDLKPYDSLGLSRVAYGGEWKGLLNIGESNYGMDADDAASHVLTGGGRNMWGFSDAKTDELVRKERSTIVESERIQALRDIEKHVNDTELLRGIQLPFSLAFGAWRKYLHNALESSSMWMNGGGMSWSAEWWVDANAPKRDINSY